MTRGMWHGRASNHAACRSTREDFRTIPYDSASLVPLLLELIDVSTRARAALSHELGEAVLRTYLVIVQH